MLHDYDLCLIMLDLLSEDWQVLLSKNVQEKVALVM